MKHMINISETGYGIVGDSFILDTEPVLGKWELTVTARKTDAGIVVSDVYLITNYDHTVYSNTVLFIELIFPISRHRQFQ